MKRKVHIKILFCLWLCLSSLGHSQNTELEKLKNILASPTPRVRTLNQLIPLLNPELRMNFTFIFNSRSPHGGLGDTALSAVDTLYPRVVLFTRDARLVLAFTGNPQKPLYNELEYIAFHDETATFELGKFILPAAAEHDPTKTLEAKQNGVANPPTCLRCHGEDPRPFTDSYPLWPGFYGSVHDTFPPDSPELGWYKTFLKKQKSNLNLVYSKLKYPKGTPTPPYIDPATFDPNQIEVKTADFPFMPNTRLGMALTELNRKRIFRKIKATPQYETTKYALLSGLLECHEIAITPTDISAVRKQLDVENKNRLLRLGFVPKGPFGLQTEMMEIGMAANLTELLYVATALGVSPADWSMAFENHSLSFFDGILSGVSEQKNLYLKEDLIYETLRDISLTDPELQPFFVTYNAFQEPQPYGNRPDLSLAFKACPLLTKRITEQQQSIPSSVVRFAELSNGSMSELSPELNLVVNKCSHCHEGNRAILLRRPIPFREPKRLATLLRGKSVSSARPLYEEILLRLEPTAIGHMPPNHSLEGHELNLLKTYLGGLIK